MKQNKAWVLYPWPALLHSIRSVHEKLARGLLVFQHLLDLHDRVGIAVTWHYRKTWIGSIPGDQTQQVNLGYQKSGQLLGITTEAGRLGNIGNGNACHSQH